MEDFCRKILERAASQGATYADVRVVRRASESIEVKTGKVEQLASATDYGFGVRALVGGAWGFACSFVVNDDEGMEVADLAVRIARASSTHKKEDVTLADVEPATGRFESQFKIDPFDVPLADKINVLLEADSIMRQNPKIAIAESSMDFWRQEQVFASSEGSYIEQVNVQSGAGILATAIGGEEIQRRSYPAPFGGDFAAAGYEFVEAQDLTGHAEETARDAAQLLEAPLCPSETTDLVLESSMLALQVHESCGHPIELDRVLGMESSFAGTSFLTTDKLGSFRYGSEAVNIVADATIPGGLGSFFFDDEGVPAQRVDIVNEGIFNGYLTSRETAPKIGRPSSGAMRADGWNSIPLIRMTNINLLPGDWTLDEILADTKHGLYASSVKSWSIDDKRLNFQFGTEVAYEIVDGSLGRMFRSPTYTGITYDFWRSCDAVAGEDEWRLWGVPNCGKGEPMQIARVGHGVAPSRFRNVRIGVVK
ncbi:MAG: TldD/PmbA family protein [Armatimonadota bacterium]|nr:TldD/PmbA family protein [Armatimonadota bacterium]